MRNMAFANPIKIPRDRIEKFLDFGDLKCNKGRVIKASPIGKPMASLLMVANACVSIGLRNTNVKKLMNYKSSFFYGLQKKALVTLQLNTRRDPQAYRGARCFLIREVLSL